MSMCPGSGQGEESLFCCYHRNHTSSLHAFEKGQTQRQELSGEWEKKMIVRYTRWKHVQKKMSHLAAMAVCRSISCP
jgi:hypothetical protein